MDPASGPAWASGGTGTTSVVEGGRQEGFKLLFAGTADKVMMLELEAEQVGRGDGCDVRRGWAGRRTGGVGIMVELEVKYVGLC